MRCGGVLAVVPEWIQWAGTVASLVGLIVSALAAVAATNAKRAAEDARRSVEGFGRRERSVELSGEIETLINANGHGSPELFIPRIASLSGRLVREAARLHDERSPSGERESVLRRVAKSLDELSTRISRSASLDEKTRWTIILSGMIEAQAAVASTTTLAEPLPPQELPS